jgi:hypothetical protein
MKGGFSLYCNPPDVVRATAGSFLHFPVIVYTDAGLPGGRSNGGGRPMGKSEFIGILYNLGRKRALNPWPNPRNIHCFIEPSPSPKRARWRTPTPC